jgi:hypothetical protein
MILSMISGICPRPQKISNDIIGLILCLFFGQLGEAGLKQGKIQAPRKFPPDLSTETVDMFFLETHPPALQPETRIGV